MGNANFGQVRDQSASFLLEADAKNRINSIDINSVLQYFGNLFSEMSRCWLAPHEAPWEADILNPRGQKTWGIVEVDFPCSALEDAYGNSRVRIETAIPGE